MIIINTGTSWEPYKSTWSQRKTTERKRQVQRRRPLRNQNNDQSSITVKIRAADPNLQRAMQAKRQRWPSKHNLQPKR